GQVRVSEDSASVMTQADDKPDAAPSLATVAAVELPPGVSQLDFDAALAVGREKGHLSQDELIEALHAVELTPEVLAALLALIQAEGVALVEEEDEEPLDEVALRRELRQQPRTAARARQTNEKRAGSGGDSAGSAEDPVHTYLKEIGRVPLLN